MTNEDDSCAWSRFVSIFSHPNAPLGTHNNNFEICMEDGGKMGKLGGCDLVMEMTGDREWQFILSLTTFNGRVEF
jgi:hypothetical protein